MATTTNAEWNVKTMIQEISIKNFLSFKDKMTFSFVADPSNFREETQVVEVAKGVRLLRFAALFGANASGKSNFLKAVYFITEFLFRVVNSKDEKTGVIPFLLDDNTRNENSEFDTVFYVNDKRFHYYLVVNTEKVVAEKLTLGNSEKEVFERVLDNNNSKIRFNVELSQIAKETIEINCLPNMSVFAAYRRVNVTIPELQMVVDYFGNFMPNITTNKDVYLYAANVLKESANANLKQTVLSDLRQADFNINDFSFTVENGEIKDNYYIKINNGEAKTYIMPGFLQSNGTHRYIGLDVILHQLLEKQSFLIADELENAIHPDLFEKFVYDFLTAKNNHSQLILTTHYSGLMETVNNMIRLDSIHFVEKHDDGLSELYSITDFDDLDKYNKDFTIYKGYREGRFGAVADISY
ncbi:MAG: AAA family ATPase [Bacteroidales bacterium]|nr:AAA family ATPase [Bacteroidales bacterium]